MLHEAFHILGFGRTRESDQEAREIARQTYNALWSDLLYCYSDEFEIPKEELRTGRYNSTQGKFGYLVNIPSGFGYRYQSVNMNSWVTEIEEIVNSSTRKPVMEIITNKDHFISPHVSEGNDSELELQFHKEPSLTAFEYCVTSWAHPDLAQNCKLSFQSTKFTDEKIELQYNGPVYFNNPGVAGASYFSDLKKTTVKVTKIEANLYSGIIETKLNSVEEIILRNLKCRRTNRPVQMN